MVPLITGTGNPPGILVSRPPRPRPRPTSNPVRPTLTPVPPVTVLKGQLVDRGAKAARPGARTSDRYRQRGGISVQWGGGPCGALPCPPTPAPQVSHNEAHVYRFSQERSRGRCLLPRKSYDARPHPLVPTPHFPQQHRHVMVTRVTYCPAGPSSLRARVPSLATAPRCTDPGDKTLPTLRSLLPSPGKHSP